MDAGPCLVSDSVSPLCVPSQLPLNFPLSCVKAKIQALLCQAFLWVLGQNLGCQVWLASTLYSLSYLLSPCLLCVPTYLLNSQFVQEKEDKRISSLGYIFITSLPGTPKEEYTIVNASSMTYHKMSSLDEEC